MIRVRNVRKSYGEGRSSNQVLDGVSLDVAAGELVALVGASGSGKSTLLHIIGGLDRPDSGTVEIDGKELGSLTDRQLSRLRNERIGFIFQAFHLLDHLTVAENVALPAFFAPDVGDVRERAHEALERVSLGQLAERRPGVLSGGQKQRVAIARALFRRPTLLLCDEPTGNLDSETGREIIQFFQKLNREDGTTFLVVTHEERVSQAASRVVRIADGQIAARESRSVELSAP